MRSASWIQDASWFPREIYSPAGQGRLTLWFVLWTTFSPMKPCRFCCCHFTGGEMKAHKSKFSSLCPWLPRGVIRRGRRRWRLTSPNETSGGTDKAWVGQGSPASNPGQAELGMEPPPSASPWPDRKRTRDEAKACLSRKLHGIVGVLPGLKIAKLPLVGKDVKGRW